MSDEPRALMLASVASMIDQFNMPNIQLLVDNGYDVDVACSLGDGNTISKERISDLKERLYAMNVNVIDVPIPRKITSIKSIFKAYKQTKKLCNERKYELVHCHSPIGSVIARLAAKDSRKKNGTRVIYTAHGFHFYKGAPIKNWLMFYPIEKWCSRYTDVLITINREDYEFAKKNMRINRIEYVPGVGVDTKKFYIEGFDKNAKKKELDISPDSFVVLSIGELNKNKNHEVVIKALGKLENKKITYVIAGKGSLEQYLADLAKANGVDLRLLGYRTDVVELLNMADVFAFPSYREGLSVSLMEAMAAGLPCVVSRIRGNVDLICDSDDCLFHPDDDKALSKLMEKLFNDEYRCSLKSKNSYRVKDLDLDIVLNRIGVIYGVEDVCRNIE